MKKKTVKKLMLAKETVRRLNPSELKAADGAFARTVDVTCNPICASRDTCGTAYC